MVFKLTIDFVRAHTMRNSIFLRLTAELAGKYALIVIFVCLCVGMWGILAGVYILAVKEWVFHLGLAFRRSCFVSVIVSYIFVIVSYFFCVCVSFFSSFSFFVDVFKSVMWSNLQAAVPRDDSELRFLADSLPDVALAGRAPSTVTKYSATYARWKRWARDQGFLAFPASPYHFALYLRHLMAGAKTAAPVESAVHAIAWVHHLAGERSPSEHLLVKDVLAGAQRLLAHHTSKKEPITVAQLEQLVNFKALPMASLYDIRSVLICLLAFAAFLRFEELAKLVRSDVETDSEKLQLFIESSKTDKYRDGAWVVVAVTGKVTCPVNMMNRYLDKAQLSHDSPLFCQLTRTKYGYKARARGLSYTRLRELVTEAFRGIVPDLARIGTHSLRSGGATAAANAGVPDRLKYVTVAGLVFPPKMAMSKILSLLVCLFLRL